MLLKKSDKSPSPNTRFYVTFFNGTATFIAVRADAGRGSGNGRCAISSKRGKEDWMMGSSLTPDGLIARWITNSQHAREQAYFGDLSIDKNLIEF